MTAIPQPDDLTRQLRSLSIVRPGDLGDQDPTPRVTAQEAPRRRSYGSGLAVLLLAGCAAAAWHWQDDLRAMVAAQGFLVPAPIAVETRAETPEAIEATPATASSPAAPLPVPAQRLVGSGYLLAGRESTIGTDIGGRLAEMMVSVGDHVTAGQPIARLDDRDAQMALSGAGLALDAAKAEVDRLVILRDQAAAKAERQKSLVARGSAPATDAEEAGFALRLAEADITSARLTVTRLGIERDRAQDLLSRLTVTAPFDGVIVETHAVAGDLIGSSLEGGPVPGIAVLTDPASLRIEADLAETALSQVTPGQTAEVTFDAWPNTRLTARVSAILPRASLQKGTITLRLELTEVPADVALLANMAAKITLIP